MKTKKILLFIGGLLLMFTLSACSFFRGTRAGIEKRIEVLEEIYPTENINDLKAKFQKGFRLVHIEYFGETTYSFVFENVKAGEENNGVFMVRKSDSEDFEYEFKVKFNEGGRILPLEELPLEYQDYLSNFKFLFQRLDLGKKERSKFDYYTHSSDANDGYFIAYDIDNPDLATYMGVKNSKLRLSIDGNFYSDKRQRFYKKLWIDSENGYISESITSEEKTNGIE